MRTLVHIFTVSQSLKFLRGQPDFMRERGWDTQVVTSPDDALQRFGTDEKVPVTGIEMPRRITPLRDLLSVLRLTLHLRRVRPDLVHAHTPKGGLLGMIAGTLACVPNRVYHMRGLPMATATGLRRVLLANTERVSCGLAHRVICVSHSLRATALEHRLAPASKLDVMLRGSGQGVDAHGRFDPALGPSDAGMALRAERNFPLDAPVIGFVGRIVRDKGISELTAAWRELRERHPSAILWLVGPLEPQDPIEPDDLRFLERDPRVHLEGYVSDPAPLYAAMDIVTLPSYREGFPNVPLEAASMQIPVVATRITGCVDAIVHNVTGLLVDPQDAVSLSRALDRYLSDAPLRREHGHAARQRVLENFDRELIWAEIARVYDELVARPPLLRRLAAQLLG